MDSSTHWERELRTRLPGPNARHGTRIRYEGTVEKRYHPKKKIVEQTRNKRNILQRSLEPPLLVGLRFAFQTDAKLYLVPSLSLAASSSGTCGVNTASLMIVPGFTQVS
jgi:hypothetical protein